MNAAIASGVTLVRESPCAEHQLRNGVMPFRYARRVLGLRMWTKKNSTYRVIISLEEEEIIGGSTISAEETVTPGLEGLFVGASSEVIVNSVGQSVICDK